MSLVRGEEWLQLFMKYYINGLCGLSVVSGGGLLINVVGTASPTGIFVPK